jgi:hypothetical protein
MITQYGPVWSPFLIFMVALTLLLTSGCSGKDIGYRYDPDKPTPDVKNLPLYPEAAVIKSQGVPGTDQVISYQAQATPEEVLTYYRSVLEKDGWSVRGTVQAANTLYMYWRNGRNNPYYRLDVLVSSQTSTTSQVRLQLLALPIE